MVWIFAFFSWTYIIPPTAIFHNTLYFEAKRQITETWCQRSTRYLKSLLHYYLVAVLLCLCHTKPYIILETLRRGAGLLQRNNKQSQSYTLCGIEMGNVHEQMRRRTLNYWLLHRDHRKSAMLPSLLSSVLKQNQLSKQGLTGVKSMGK